MLAFQANGIEMVSIIYRTLIHLVEKELGISKRVIYGHDNTVLSILFCRI